MVTYVMSMGSKPGDSPSYANENVYYNTPTNPLLINDEGTNDAETVCYEIRNDNSIPKHGDLTSGTITTNGAVSEGNVTFNVDNGDPRIYFKVGHHIYGSSTIGHTTALQRFMGTIESITCTGASAGTIVLTAGSDYAVADGEILYTSEGVSEGDSYNIMNRIYPDTYGDSQAYLENLENTSGFRIKCYDDATSTGTRLNSIDITVNDYFVMINAEDINNHHFAKITEILTDDVSGDAFEFSPKYGSEVSKNTKFTIWKGPEVSDTSVVAVSYGLASSGSQAYSTTDANSDGVLDNDSRHAGMTYVSKPLFYFYNDRLDKPNQLNHNTKYQIWTSWSNDGSNKEHWNACFLTCQDYGLKVKDYGPFTMNATFVDKLRDYDEINWTGSAKQSFSHYGNGVSNHISYVTDPSDWDLCFKNNRRHSFNIASDETAVVEGSFIGPTRYLHYDTSPDKCNKIPETLEVEVFNSVTASSGYVDLKIADPMRIYGSKIKKADKIKVKKLIHQGIISSSYDFALPGIWNAGSGATQGTAGSFILTVEFDNDDYLPEVWLESDDGSNQYWDTFRIGGYHFRVYDVGSTRETAAPYFVQGKTTFKVECRAWKNSSDGIWDTVMTNAPAISNETAYRKAWSKSKQNLLVNLNMDTTVTYAADPTPTTAREQVYYGNTKIYDTDGSVNSLSKSELYDAELVLIGGPQKGVSFKINYGDDVHKVIKLQTPHLQLYRKETADDGNFLSYYNGGYVILKTIFIGEVETFKNYIDDGLLKHHIAGRNKSNKLLGPIVNKDYSHSEDIIYSTIGPLEKITALGFNSSTTLSGDEILGNWVGDNIIYIGGTISGVSVGDLLFTQEGYFIGRIKEFPGGQYITLEEGSYVTLYDRVNTDSIQPLYVIKPDRNYLSLSKAMSKNTITSNAVSSLTGAANKGLLFTSGKSLINDAYGRPNTNGSELIGSSASGKPNSLGYSLYQPNSIFKDDSFFTELKDEITPTSIKKHTVNSLTEYEIVSVETNKGSTLLEVAPNCPIVMGRIDENHADTTLDTLTISDYKFAGAESEGEYAEFIIDGAPAAMHTALNGKHLYLSDSAYLGKMLGLEYKTASDAYITLDRKLPRAISANEYIYTSTEKTHGLYLINTQGLRNGGVLQLLNSELSTEGKPIIYNSPLDTSFDGDLNYHDLSYRFGGFTYRYINLQLANKGSLYYNKLKMDNGESSSVYSRKKGEFNAYASTYKIIPGIITNPVFNDRTLDNDYSNLFEKQGSPESRGIYSAAGGNFADNSIYATGNVPTALTLLPKNYSAREGGIWNRSKHNTTLSWDNNRYSILGNKENSITHSKDGLEIIDPKTITPFLFSPSDMWPDSFTREHHIGNISRDFKDYNIMLRSEPRRLTSGVKHRSYGGQTHYAEENNDSYQTLNISGASINTNEMKRLGLMRLIECTYDWHFNLVDPENPPEKKDLVDVFTYDRYQKVVASGTYVQSGGYSSGDTVITTMDAASSGSPADPRTPFAQYYVWTDKGEYIGSVSSTSTTQITLSAAAKKPNGQLYYGQLYYLNQATNGGHAYGYAAFTYPLSGRDGKATFIKAEKNSSGRRQGGTYYSGWTGQDQAKLHMLQGAVFNGNANTNLGGYGMGTNNEFSNYFQRKMDFYNTGDGEYATFDYLHHIVLPPVFGGFMIKNATFEASSSTHNARIATYGMSAGDIFQLTYSATYDHSDTSNHNFSVDDKIYTEDGQYVGQISQISGRAGGAEASMTFHDPIKVDLDKTNSMLLMIGTGHNESATHGANLGGYHPLGPAAEIQTYSNPSSPPPAEYVHPSKVLNAMQYEIPVRARGTFAKEYFRPLSVSGTTYASVRGSPDTFTSSANNFITDGFQVGQIINVTGPSSSYISQSHRITAVAAGTLTLSTNTTVVDEAAGVSTWVIKAATGGEIQSSIYDGLRVVVLDNFKIESAGDYKADIGSSMPTANAYTDPTTRVKMGGKYESSQQVYKHTFYAINTPHERFANYQTTELWNPSSSRNELIKNEGSNSGAGEHIATGIDMVFKPLLQTISATKNYGYHSPNGQDDLTQLVFDTSGDVHNKWLEFVPNLTGCYLVSNDGVRINGEEVLTTSNVWVDSLDDRHPSKIHYIVSHTIRTDTLPATSPTSDNTDGLHNYHVLLIDNCDASDELFGTYRIMRPAQVCLWPESPTKIDLYKTTCGYTKKPNSSSMYSDVGDISFYEDGFLKGENSSAAYNEAIQSMYVVVNPDHTSTSNRFLVPRTTSGNHISELFGAGKMFNDGAYDMLMNDGIEKYRRNISVNTNSKTISGTAYNYTVIDYGEHIENKMSGIVSLGEIFTINSGQEVKLKNPTKASIGTSVTIGQDAEDIINDVLETNSIQYIKSDKEKLYITAPNLQGSDLYTAIDYLAKLKDKEINITRDNIELISKTNNYKYLGLEINETDSDINVIEIEQDESAFGFYNEVILYGNGFKSVRRNAKSIRDIGKVTYEEFDDTLYSQSEVEQRAQSLLSLFTANQKRVTVKCTDENLELIKAGDIIVIDYPSEHIPRSYYMILEIRYNTLGQLELECGGYTKTLDNHLASLILSQKKLSSYLRKSKFKSLEVDDIYYDSMKLKPIKLSMTRQTTEGNTKIELNTPAATDTTQAIGNLTNEDVLWEEYK